MSTPPVMSALPAPQTSRRPAPGPRSRFVLAALLAVSLLLAATASGQSLPLQLKTGSFDPAAPAAQLAPQLKAQLDARRARPAQEGAAHYFVQFTRPLTRAERRRYREEQGLRLDRYVPQLAYLERLDPAALQRLRGDPVVRAVFPHLPEFKLDPAIARRGLRAGEPPPEGGLVLRLIPHDGAEREALVTAVEAAGAEVVTTVEEPASEIFRLLVRVASAGQAGALAELGEVRYLEPVGRISLNNASATAIVQGDAVGAHPVWDHGLRGEGQIIGHIDNPIDLGHCFFRDPMDNTPGPLHRKVVGARDVTHDVGNIPFHGTMSAGTAAGADVNDTLGSVNPNNGHAPAARLSHSNFEDLPDTDPPGPVSFYTALSQAAADGATIHSNSWDEKDSKDYTQLSRDLDRFVWENEDHLVLVAPENETATGDGEIHPPVNAINSLAVNAFDRNPIIGSDVYFSGVREFTLDGRRKPDAMAPGKEIVTAVHGTACTTDIRSSLPDGGTARHSGTSLATPAVAGAAALVRQYYTEGWYPTGSRQPHHAFIPSGALLKATLLNGTRRIGLPYPGGPNSGQGWGRVVLEDSLYFAGDAGDTRVWDVRHSAGLATGESRTYPLRVESGAEPVKITLVWTGPPAEPEAAAPVTNDLDLVVTAPPGPLSTGGETYYGNNFDLQQSQGGEVRDSLNNVETVLVLNPPPGEWTITVEGTAVNSGRPGQGYAVVATADLPDPPSPLGVQNVLVVRARYAGNPLEPPAADLLTTMAAVDSHFQAATYGQVTLVPELYPDPVPLSHAQDWYEHPSRNLLIELAQEVIEAVGETAFEGATADPGDDIDRLVIVTNASDPGTEFGPGDVITDDHATTGPWPYDLPPGLPRPISVSVHPHDSPLARFVHGMGHQLGLIDLGPYRGLEFAQPRVDAWDHMAAPLTGSDFLAFSKVRPGWLSPADAEYVPRPASGVVTPPLIPLNFLGSAGGNRAIAVGLTEGAASLGQEDVFYWIEARSREDGGPDDGVVPETGVLVYKVYEDVPQGAGPVRIIDQDLSTISLDDAAFDVGQTTHRADAGLDVTVRAGTATADRRIELRYEPPSTDNDVYVTVGDPFYTSPDIWVDAPLDGLAADDPAVPAMDRDEQPVPGVTNHVYVRLWNRGATAYDVTAYVRASEPYHTVGGEADFNRPIGEIHVPSFDPDDSPLVRFVEWTPDDDGNPHACIEVDVPEVFNDVNPHNNRAQQNVEKDLSARGSPFDPVTYRFGLTNGESFEQLYYFRADGVPPGWSADLTPEKALLAPSDRVDGRLVLSPPDDAAVCTEHRIRVTAWAPRGDTLVPVGGGVVQVDLRNRTDLVLRAGTEPCAHDPDLLAGRSPCRRVTATGCTDPPRPFEEIVVRYDHPSGYPIYRTVTTDAAGCFSDFLVVPDGGVWEVSAVYPGGDCSGGAQTPAEPVAVDLGSSGDADGDGLPDPDEPQGDRDGDGIVGLYDPDSDGDGTLDGDEPPGDCDRDGVPNVSDADSDDDGIRDGDDRTPCGGPAVEGGRLSYSFHVGSAHPLEALNRVADANVYAAVDAGYRLTDRVSLLATVGLAQLTAESDAAIDHPRWLHASLNARWALPATASGLRPYLRGGPGLYRPKGGSSDPGFNVGAGARVPISPAFALEFGADYHRIDSDGGDRFCTLQLGVVFR